MPVPVDMSKLSGPATGFKNKNNLKRVRRLVSEIKLKSWKRCQSRVEEVVVVLNVQQILHLGGVSKVVLN